MRGGDEMLDGDDGDKLTDTGLLKPLCTVDVERACVDLPIRSNGMAA